MALPIVAVVGRPNVGKSTLVNRIAQTNTAIVHEMRGVTRDRTYHKADWNGIDFLLVDTGGIEMNTQDDFQESITKQALYATNEADAVIFLVDSRSGVQTDDLEVATILKRAKIPTVVAVNKLDNPANDGEIWEFDQLGLGSGWPISALHGHGTGDLLDEVVGLLDGRVEAEEVEERDCISVAIIGRPNAGKSSLANKMCKEDRSIVSDVAGTTRDAIDTFVEHDSKLYKIIDTAGLRLTSQIDESVEYYSYVRAMRAIDEADVALLVIDSTIGLTNEDQRITNYASERGCAFVIVLNKWDIVGGPEVKEKVRGDIEDYMQFASYAPVVAISALTGKKLDRIWTAIDESYAHFCANIPTSKLNAWLAQINETGHTVTKGKTVLRIKYITQTSTKPPSFTFFCNRPDVVTDNYIRFLENRFRKTFPLTGTPIRFKFKKKD